MIVRKYVEGIDQTPRPSLAQCVIACGTNTHTLGSYTASLSGKRIWPHETSEGDAERGGSNISMYNAYSYTEWYHLLCYYIR